MTPEQLKNFLLLLGFEATVVDTNPDYVDYFHPDYEFEGHFYVPDYKNEAKIFQYFLSKEYEGGVRVGENSIRQQFRKLLNVKEDDQS